MKMSRSSGHRASLSTSWRGWHGERVTVVLTGEGSDETLAGYTRYAWTLLNSTHGPYVSFDHAGIPAQPRAKGNSAQRLCPRRCIASWSILSWCVTALRGRRSTSTISIRRSRPANIAELLTPRSTAAHAGDAYDGSMEPWERSSGDLLHRLLYTDINTYLIELLMKQDQMSMAASIESRVPFLDHQAGGIHGAHTGRAFD